MCLSEPSEGSPVCTTERVLTVWQPLAAYGAEHTLGKRECMCVVITTIIGLLTCWRQAFAILHMLCTACTSLHTSTKILCSQKIDGKRVKFYSERVRKDMAGKVDLKVVLLGKEYGGKTSLVERYIHNKFNSNAPYQSVSWRVRIG